MSFLAAEHKDGGRHTANESSSFCDPTMPMAMYMDGFHAPLITGMYGGGGNGSTSSSSLSCLLFLSSSFELSTRLRFILAMFASFSSALSLTALARLRRHLQCMTKREEEEEVNSESTSDLTVSQQRQRQRRNFVIALLALDMIQVALGYVSMLIVMSYSIELLLSVISGFMVGHFLFNRNMPCYDDDDNNEDSDRRRISSSTFRAHSPHSQQLFPLGISSLMTSRPAASSSPSELDPLLQPLIS